MHSTKPELEIERAFRKCFFQLDSEAAMDLVSRHISTTIGADSCAVFLRRGSFSHIFDLASTYTRSWGYLFPPGHSPVQSNKHGRGLISEVESRMSGLNLDRAEIQERTGSRYFDPNWPNCNSLMLIPFVDVAKHMQGLVTVCNKVGAKRFSTGDFIFAQGMTALLGRTLRDIDQVQAILTAERSAENALGAGIGDLLGNILRVIRTTLKVQKGIIYTYDPINSLLRCAAMIGRFPAGIEPRALKFHILTPALLTWVFNNSKPAAARIGEDPRVHAGCIERLRLSGNLFAAPLRTPNGNIGAIVLWDHTGSLPPKTISKRLVEFAKIAAAATALWASKKADETFFHNMIDTLPACVIRKDLRKRFTYANEAFRKELGGKALAEVIGARDFDFYPRTIARAYRADDSKVIEKGEVLSQSEKHYQYKGGPLRYVQVVKGPVWNSQGQTKGIQAVFVDVTANILKDQLFERTSDIVFSHDEKGVILSINRAGQKLLGIDPKRGQKVRIYQFLLPAERNEMMRIVRASAHAARAHWSPKEWIGNPSYKELRLRAVDGRICRIQYSTTAVLLSGDRVLFHGIARDLTVEDRMRAEAERRKKTAYAITQSMLMGHEVGKPLDTTANILKCLDNVCTNVRRRLTLYIPNEDDPIQPVSNIAAQLRVQNDAALRGFDELGQGKQSRFDIGMLLQQIAFPIGLRSGFQATIRVPKEGLKILAPKVDLATALRLLIENAYDHRAPKSKLILIRASSDAPRKRARVSIENKGFLSETALDRFRTSELMPSTKPRSERDAHGQGLVIARSIINTEIGGKILLRNVKRNARWSVQTLIYLPLRPKPAKSREP